MSTPNTVLPLPDEPIENAETSTFGAELAEFERTHQSAPPRDDTPQGAIEGSVVTVTPEAIYLDIGRKMEGVLPASELKTAGLDEPPKPGDTITVSVTGRDEGGYYTLSAMKVDRPKDWTALLAAFNEKKIIAGTVIESIKGGLRVDIGVTAFLPASRSGVREINDLPKLIGQEIQCRITKLDTEKEDVVVDRRGVLEEEGAKAKEEKFKALAEDSVMKGRVRTLTDFGAFVDLGGVDGLLHVGDMSWHRIAKPADVMKPGDTVEVKILKINRDTRKISLGMKQLVPDPWTQAAGKFNPGDRVKGIVARVADFGAFVELEPGVDGLVHLSEMSWSKKIRKPSDIVKPGDQVEVVVLGVNAGEKRISLGLKQALGDPWDEIAEKYPVGSVVEAPVVSLQKFGAFVDLGDGVEGMIHIGDISHEKRLEHPKDVLQSGKTVRAQVLEIDKERRRLRLGMKQLEPTALDIFIGEHKIGDTFTGRVSDVSATKAKIEISEGVFADYRLAPEQQQPKEKPKNLSPVDVNQLSILLNARWRGAPGGPAKEAGPPKDLLKVGQVRSVKISNIDTAKKKIDVELA